MIDHTRSFALTSVTVVDGYGDAPLENHAVVVTDGRIEAVLPMAQYVADPDRLTYDLPGHFVMPGLIDAHVHLAGGRADVMDQEIGAAVEHPTVRAMRSVYEAQQLLRRGFTTVRDISWNGLYLKRIFVEELIPGPKVIACGPGLSRTGGHADLHHFDEQFAKSSRNPFGMVADGPVEIQKVVRGLLREGADAVKIWVSGGDNWPHDRVMDTHYSAEEVRACVEEAHRQQGTIVAAHAETNESITLAVEAGVDTIEHGEDLDEVLVAKMLERGTILVPTLTLIVNWFRDFMPGEGENKIRPDAFLYRDHFAVHAHNAGEEASERAVRSFQLALKSGVKIALGSDTVFEPLTQHGMTTMQAITAATAVGAEAVGMSHVLGTVEPGKIADLLVVRQDPTQSPEVLYNAENIHLTFCNGRLTVKDGLFTW